MIVRGHDNALVFVRSLINTLLSPGGNLRHQFVHKQSENRFPALLQLELILSVVHRYQSKKGKEPGTVST